MTLLPAVQVQAVILNKLASLFHKYTFLYLGILILDAEF